MHVAICSPVIVSDVFLLAREQISDYKEVLDTDSNYYIFFLSVYIADQSYCYRSDFSLFSIVCVIISSFETLLAIQVVNTIWRDNLRHFR